jgi:hypothetical protein
MVHQDQSQGPKFMVHQDQGFGASGPKFMVHQDQISKEVAALNKNAKWCLAHNTRKTFVRMAAALVPFVWV